MKVDVVKILDKGEILEEDYDLVEADLRKFLICHFGHSMYFDSHPLKRIDYKMDIAMPNPKDRELLFHLLEKYTAKYAYKKKLNGVRMKMETLLNTKRCNTTNVIVLS